MLPAFTVRSIVYELADCTCDWPFDLIKDQALGLRAASSEVKGTIPVELRAPRHNTHPASFRLSVSVFFLLSFPINAFISFFLTSFAVLSLSGRQSLN